MKIIFTHRWLRPDNNLVSIARQKISKLSAFVRIEAAQITLERNAGSSPPYLARVHLAIPGPDLHVEEKDHTPEATIHKVLAKLSRQIRHRKAKQLAKRREGAEECKPWNRSHQPLSLQMA